MPESDYDRLLRTSLREAEAKIVALVERDFAPLPLDAYELPWIGAFPYCDRPDQKRLAIAALTAKVWFRHEAPLTTEACAELIDGPWRGNRRRASLRGCYGLHARSVLWAVELMTPFEVFCAHELAPSTNDLRRAAML